MTMLGALRQYLPAAEKYPYYLIRIMPAQENRHVFIMHTVFLFRKQYFIYILLCFFLAQTDFLVAQTRWWRGVMGVKKICLGEEKYYIDYRMTIKKRIWEVYGVTDSVDFAKKLVEAGVDAIQYRDKNIDDELFVLSAKEIKRFCDDVGIIFIINDRFKLLSQVGAGGVHVGLGDGDLVVIRKIIGPDKILGYSVKTSEQAVYAQNCGADYVSVSPVFDTINKTSESGVGLLVLAEISKSVSVPVLAIGGINSTNLKSVIRAGAVGAAFIGELMNAVDLKNKIVELKSIYRLCQR